MKRKQYFFGLLAYYISSILSWTMKIKIESHPNRNPEQPYLFAFWHGKQFLPVLKLNRIHFTEGAVLVSPSKDGDILSTWLNKMGYETIRGSSRRDNVSALTAMIRRIKKGQSLGFGIDGPLGPIYKVKPGMTHMAQKLNIGIVPIGSCFSRCFTFEKAWDRFELPKPFSTAVLYLGEPVFIDEKMDLEQANRLLEKKIHQAEDEAKRRLN